MTLELKETVANSKVINDINIKKNYSIRELFPTHKTGQLIGMLIAERRFNQTGLDHQIKINNLAQKLSIYEGIFPDPLNKQRKLNLSRLISSIDKNKTKT